MSAKIAAALHQVMEKTGYVQKTGKNTFHNYTYAGEADLLTAVRPALVEAGLILIPSINHVSPIDAYGNIFIRVEYTLVHKDGDIWPEKIYAEGAGNDINSRGGVGDKGLYKAITGANKYLLFKLLQIATGDDPEKDESVPAPLVAVPEQPNIVFMTHTAANADPVPAFVLPTELTGETAMPIPTRFSEWADTLKAITLFVESQDYQTLRSFWRNNVAFFKAMEKSHKLDYERIQVLLKAKSPVKKA